MAKSKKRKNKTVNKKSSSIRNKKVIKNENINVKTPDWFDKNITKNSISSDEENQLEELLKEYK